MEKVTIKKVIKNDGLTIQLLIASVIFLIMGVIFIFYPDLLEDLGLMIMALLWGACFIGLIIRLIMLISFKHSNIVYKAKITGIFTYRSNKRIRYEYQVNNVNYKKTNMLLSSKLVRQLKTGDEVDIYISTKNPKKALLRDFYFEDINL